MLTMSLKHDSSGKSAITVGGQSRDIFGCISNQGHGAIREASPDNVDGVATPIRNELHGREVLIDVKPS